MSARRNQPPAVQLTDADRRDAIELRALHRAARKEHERGTVGYRLASVRARYPASGPGVAGWRAYLAAAGLSDRTARRYIAEVRDAPAATLADAEALIALLPDCYLPRVRELIDRRLAPVIPATTPAPNPVISATGGAALAVVAGISSPAVAGMTGISVASQPATLAPVARPTDARFVDAVAMLSRFGGSCAICVGAVAIGDPIYYSGKRRERSA